jgi:hypothetical protein
MLRLAVERGAQLRAAIVEIGNRGWSATAGARAQCRAATGGNEGRTFHEPILHPSSLGSLIARKEHRVAVNGECDRFADVRL